MDTLRNFPFITGTTNRSPECECECALHYANITGTDECQNSYSHSGTHRSGSPSLRGDRIPQPVFADANLIPQVQLPPNWDASLRNPMPQMPAYNAHWHGWHNGEHNGDPLDESAVSPEDRVLLQNRHQKLMDIRSLAIFAMVSGLI